MFREKCVTLLARECSRTLRNACMGLGTPTYEGSLDSRFRGNDFLLERLNAIISLPIPLNSAFISAETTHGRRVL